MTTNSDTKFEEEPTCCCKNHLKNLMNFHFMQALKNLKISTLIGYLCPKSIKY